VKRVKYAGTPQSRKFLLKYIGAVMAEKYPNVVERCKENFAYKDQLDKEKNVIPKRIPTKDMGMER